MSQFNHFRFSLASEQIKKVHLHFHFHTHAYTLPDYTKLTSNMNKSIIIFLALVALFACVSTLAGINCSSFSDEESLESDLCDTIRCREGTVCRIVDGIPKCRRTLAKFRVPLD